MLRRTLNRRIGATGLPVSFLMKLWGAAIAGSAAAWGVKLELAPAVHPVMAAVFVLPLFVGIYFAVTLGLRVPEASTALARLRSPQ